MKTKWIRAAGLCIAAGGLMLIAGCAIEPNGRVVFAPPVVVATPGVVVAPAPPPPPPEPVYVPDTYVWDGYEYVGVVGDQYFYLGPGNVWLVCDPFHLDRFHGWERYHHDWRAHAIRNDRFRTDRYGHVQPRRGGPEKRRDDRH